MADHTAFMVIDIQNDYFPGGAMPLYQTDVAAEKARAALHYARSQHHLCIIVQHISRDPNATFFRPSTVGAQLHRQFLPILDDIHIVKHYPNAFRETLLAHYLETFHIRSLVIAGMMTHMCIDATVRAAHDSGYHITLLSDATATKELQYGPVNVSAERVQAAYLAALEDTYAQILSSGQWINASSDKS